MEKSEEVLNTIKEKVSKFQKKFSPAKQGRSFEEGIRNRESWLKVFVVGFSVLVIGWKILRSDTPMVDAFRFGDLLAVLTAFFAVGLSAVFYMKTVESNKHTYEKILLLSKELSEKIGIEQPRQIKHHPESYLQQQTDMDLADRFYEVLFSRISVTDLMNFGESEVNDRFESTLQTFSQNDLEFLFKYGLLTSAGSLSDTAHQLIQELKIKFRFDDGDLYEKTKGSTL